MRTRLLTRRCSRYRLGVTALLWCLSAGAAHPEGSPSYLDRANDILNRWAARKDTETSLLAGQSGQWSIRTMAAQLYPSLVLTSWFTNQDLFNGLLLETLRDEQNLTARLSVFPDDYHLRNRRFVRSSRNPDEILINASAYAGGLARIASITGHGPWTERLRGIIDALFLRANVVTDFADGPLPSNDLRVTGRVLKTLPLLAELFQDEGYLYYARRIADAYCVGVMPKNGGLPAERWNFETDRAKASSLILNEDGVSFIEGLVALYAVEVRGRSARADIYRPTLSAMFDVLLQYGLKENGRFYRRLQPDGRGGYSIDRKRESPFTTRILTSAYHYGQLSGNRTYSERAIAELSKYRMDKEALRELPSLLNAVVISPRAADLVSLIREKLVASPSPHDLNETRDAILLNALLALNWAESGGTRAIPWRPDVRVQSTVKGETLSITLSLEKPWAGRISPSYNRPPSVVSASEFPDLFHIHPDESYEIRANRAAGSAIWDGSLLADGLRANLHRTYVLEITRVTTDSSSRGPDTTTP